MFHEGTFDGVVIDFVAECRTASGDEEVATGRLEQRFGAKGKFSRALEDAAAFVLAGL